MIASTPNCEGRCPSCDFWLNGAVDESTGSPFTDVASLLEQHIQRSIPDPNETMFVMVDGQVVTRSSDDPPVRLDLDPGLLDQVRSSKT